MMDVRFSLTGDRELRRLFEKLPTEAITKAAAPAMRAALQPILAAAIRNAPVDPHRKEGEHLKDTLVKRVVVYKKNNVVWGGVGPESRLAPHAHLTEFGTAERHWKTRGGRSTGSVKAQRWLQRALDEQEANARAILAAQLQKGIIQQGIKLGVRV